MTACERGRRAKSAFSGRPFRGWRPSGPDKGPRTRQVRFVRSIIAGAGQAMGACSHSVVAGHSNLVCKTFFVVGEVGGCSTAALLPVVRHRVGVFVFSFRF